MKEQVFKVDRLSYLVGGAIGEKKAELLIDLRDLTLKILEGNDSEETIMKVRFASLQELGNVGFVIILSWIDKNENMEDYCPRYAFFKTTDDDAICTSIQIINAIRRLQFERVAKECNVAIEEAKNVVEFYQPLLVGDLPCSIEGIEQSQFFCIMDRECIAMFPSMLVDRPVRRVFFYKEAGDNVIENIKRINEKDSNVYKIDCPNTKLTIFHQVNFLVLANYVK